MDTMDHHQWVALCSHSLCDTRTLGLLLVIGCATTKQQSTSAQTAQVEKYDKSGWVR